MCEITHTLRNGGKMEIKITNQGDVYEIALSGWLDTNTVPELEKSLEQIPESATELTLELGELEYTSSAGIRQFVAAHKKMKGNLKLKNARPEILDVLGMTGLDKRLTIE